MRFEHDRYETIVGQDRTTLDASRREIDQYRIKVEGLTHDVKHPLLCSFHLLEKRSFSYAISTSNYLQRMNVSMN